MSQHDSALTMPERTYAPIVDALIARHGWQLLERGEFMRRTHEHLQTSGADDAGRVAVYVYSRALHAACAGGEGAERQNRAYTELFRYLYDCAAHRYAGTHEEVAQRALARVFTSFARCREPGAFLAFALQQLLDAARALRREHAPAGSLAEPLGEDADAVGALPDTRQPDPSSVAILGELRSRFAQLADEFLRKHPRASQQFAALRLKFIDGLDDTTIARLLGKPVPNVYVLRARAIEKLRGEPSWRALAAEFDILPDE